MWKRSRYFFLPLAFFLIIGGIWHFIFSPGGHRGPEIVIETEEAPSLPVEFINEHVSLTIETDHVTATGRYRFRCNSSLAERFPILFPFPVDDGHAYPERITASQPDSAYIPFTEDRRAGAIRFTANLLTYPEFTVSYTQRITVPEARYILVTTAAWGKPLEQAVFTASLPDSLQPNEFSYPPDAVRKDNCRRIYTFERKNFMPVRDFIVSWK